MSDTLLAGGIAALVSILGSWLVYRATRGKTQVDAKTALDNRIDLRVKTQMEADWARMDKLTTRVKELEDHSETQDGKLRELEERDARKSSIFQRIFTTLASLLPEGVAPHLELTTTEIALVGDTLPRDWIKQHKENP